MFINFIFFKYNFIFLEDFGFWLIIFLKVTLFYFLPWLKNSEWNVA